MAKSNEDNSHIDDVRQRAMNAVEEYLKIKRWNYDGHIIQHVARLISKDEDGVSLDEGIAYGYKDLCIEILALLSDPEISNKIDNSWQPIIGRRLLRLIDFFENIDDTACLTALTFYQTKYSNSIDDLECIERNYKMDIKKAKLLQELNL